MTENTKNIKLITLILATYYLVGVIGIFYFPTLFIPLSWVSILGSFLVITYFHEKINFKLFLSFVTITFISFSIEVLGVHTGVIFGDYYYGEGLGTKIYGVPIIIGLNWFVLILCCNQVSKYLLNLNLWVGAIFSSLLMVMIDYVLELAAPDLDFWHFSNGMPPIRNYLAWFFISLFFSLFFGKSLTSSKNTFALPYLVIQLLFFIFLISLKLILI